MLTRIKKAIGGWVIRSFERHGLTVVEIGSSRIKAGDWFSIKKIVRHPNDGSWRGDLFRADKVEGDFVACTRFGAIGGGGLKMSLHIPDYELQTLSKSYVLSLRPELNAVS